MTERDPVIERRLRVDQQHFRRGLEILRQSGGEPIELRLAATAYQALMHSLMEVGLVLYGRDDEGEHLIVHSVKVRLAMPGLRAPMRVDVDALCKRARDVCPALLPEQATTLVEQFFSEQYDPQEAVLAYFEKWLAQPRADALRWSEARRRP